MSKLTNKKRLLLVEDDEDDYILTFDYLEQMPNHQFDIDWVDNPRQAMELLQENSHDICLLDYQLGGVNGLEVLKQTSENGCTVPIIMLTGQIDSELDNSALDAGAVDYLVKSDLDSARFNRAIRYALARKDIENERLERIKAETKSRSKDKFLAHLSHELRTPLTSILGYTELLLSDSNNQAIKGELSTIFNNGKHLLGLLNNVLDLSKISAGKFELNTTTISLENFISDIYTLMLMSAQEKGINLRLTAKSALPTKIIADPLRLRQILINIIHNAIKFTHEGSVHIELWLDETSDGLRLYFSITDTGIGIPSELLPTIFKPFEQVQDIVSRNEEGVGLGLSICSELLNHMGGNISVESTLERGSQFIVCIDPGKIANTERKTLTFNSDNYQPTTELLSKIKGRVLVVDDNDDIRKLLGFTCRSFGLDVSYAKNGQQAISTIVSNIETETPFDLVLMDIHMPVLDGKRAMSKLNTINITTPVFAITAATMKGVAQELYDLGFSDVVAKPIDKEELHQKIKAHLELNTSAAKPPQKKAPEKTPQQVLLVEDDVDAAKITALLLNTLGKQVTIAHNIKHAKELIETDANWQHMLIDMNLPDGNGLELSEAIKSKTPTTTVTIVSGNDVSKEELNRYGADSALLKPINSAMLQQLFTNSG